MTVIDTPRLILRDWEPRDSAPFARLNADPKVMEFFPKTLTHEESDAMIARIREKSERDGFALWAVELRETGELIGMTGLTSPLFVPPCGPCVEVGWRLAREHWGKGYATEAALASLRHGFQKLGLDEIVAFTVRHNVRSRRVMERIGMWHDPSMDFNHPRLPEDSPLRPHVLYRIRAAEWKAAAGNKKAPEAGAPGAEETAETAQKR